MAGSWKLNIGVASFLAFSIYLGFGMILPIFPNYVDLLGGGGLEVGLLLASFMFTRAFLARPFGRLSDRVGRKKVIITGMFLYGLLAFLFTLPQNWWGLILVRVLQGTASAMVWPVGEALVVDSAPPSKRSRSISVYIFLTNIGIVAGPLIGGLILYIAQDVAGLSELTSMRTPFYFTSAVSFIAAFFGLVFLKDKLTVVKDQVSQRVKEEKAKMGIGKRTRLSLNMLYANSFFEGFSWSLGSVVMFFFMEQNFGIGARDFSILFGAGMGLGLLFVIPTGYFTEGPHKKPVIVHASMWGRYSTIIMSLTPLLPFGKILSLITFVGKDIGRQVAQPATRALQADIVPTRIRGRLIATIQAISNVGATIGPILGGLVWDMTHEREYSIWFMELPGYSIPFLISAFMGIIAALLVQRFVHEPKGHSIKRSIR